MKNATWRGEAIEYIEVDARGHRARQPVGHEVLGRIAGRAAAADAPAPGRGGGARQRAHEGAGDPAREVRFSRKDVREATGWSDTQLRVHLGRLAELEYLLVHRGARGQSFEYELLYDGDGSAGAPPLGTDRYRYDAEFAGCRHPTIAGSTRPQRGPVAGGSPESDAPLEPSQKSTSPAATAPITSYPHAARAHSLSRCTSCVRPSSAAKQHVLRRKPRSRRARCALDPARANLLHATRRVPRVRASPPASRPTPLDMRERALDALHPLVRRARPRAPQDVTRPILQRYQRYLFHYRKPNGEPLAFSTQASTSPCR